MSILREFTHAAQDTADEDAEINPPICRSRFVEMAKCYVRKCYELTWTEPNPYLAPRANGPAILETSL